MYKIYFRQALETLKQNKFISLISILGTALAIMMIMAIIVSTEVKNVSILPEPHRDRTLYISRQKQIRGEGNYRYGSMEYPVIKNYLLDLETPAYVSAITGIKGLVSREGSDDIITQGGIKLTDASYWHICDFTFLEGRPFSEEAFQSGRAEAVISQNTARKIFQGEEVLGQTLLIDFKPYRIVGMVKDVSAVFDVAYANIWIPYSSRDNIETSGFSHVILLAKDKKDFPDIAREVRGRERKYESENDEWDRLILRGPDTHRIKTMDVGGEEEEDVHRNIRTQNRKRAFILLVLLLVPAINLSSLSLSRIKKRTEEIGIRKAFGAKKHTILIQVLYENLVTSLLGGIIGLLMSYAVVFQMKNWLLGLSAEQTIPVSTLISFPVVLAVVVVCLILNLLSAGIPAYKAARMTIISSLNQNDHAL